LFIVIQVFKNGQSSSANGGMLGGSGGTVKFINCVFNNYTILSNTSGGIYGYASNGGVINLENGDLQITNCSFNNCSTKGNGGICKVFF
jgi:hypothetical protein